MNHLCDKGMELFWKWMEKKGYAVYDEYRYKQWMLFTPIREYVPFTYPQPHMLIGRMIDYLNEHNIKWSIPFNEPVADGPDYKGWYWTLRTFIAENQ
jgi:hypothetical protein